MPITVQSQDSYTQFVHQTRERVKADYAKGVITKSAKKLLFLRYLDTQKDPNNPYWSASKGQLSRSDLLALCQYQCSDDDNGQTESPDTKAVTDYIANQIWMDKEARKVLSATLPTERSDLKAMRDSLDRFVNHSPLQALSYFRHMIYLINQNPYQKPNGVLRLLLDNPAYHELLDISLDTEPLLFHLLLNAKAYKLTPEEIQSYVKRSTLVAAQLSQEADKLANRWRQYMLGKMIIWLISQIINIPKSPSKNVLAAAKEFSFEESRSAPVKKTKRIFKKPLKLQEEGQKIEHNPVDHAPLIADKTDEESFEIFRTKSESDESSSEQEDLVSPVFVKRAQVTNKTVVQDTSKRVGHTKVKPVLLDEEEQSDESVVEPVLLKKPSPKKAKTPAPLKPATPSGFGRVIPAVSRSYHDISALIAALWKDTSKENVILNDEPPLIDVPPIVILESPVPQVIVSAEAIAHAPKDAYAEDDDQLLIESPQVSPIVRRKKLTFLDTPETGRPSDKTLLMDELKTPQWTGIKSTKSRTTPGGRTPLAKRGLNFYSEKGEEQGQDLPPVTEHKSCVFM